MNTKILLASVAVAVVAAALIGVAAAEFAAENQTALWVNSEVEPPCVKGDYSQLPEWCVNATTGEHVCAQNATAKCYGYCYGWSGAGEGAYQNGDGYGYDCSVGAQEQYQNQYRYGSMGSSGAGFGCGW